LILDINLTAAKQLGMERAALLNTRVYQYMFEEDRDTFFAHLRAAFNTGSRQTCELRLRKRDGMLLWAQLEGIAVQVRSERFSALMPDAEASATNPTNRCLTTITDISDCKHAEELLKSALSDKDMLMKEILHRTKNNMSTIISLLHLLTFRHQENAPMTRIFQDIEQRIQAMLLVQQQLYQSENLVHIDLKEYLDELVPLVFHNLQARRISLCLETEPVVVSPDLAISCGLLLNELLTNALKYAFPQAHGSQPDLSAEIRVTLQRINAETVELQVSDNGVGLPEDFDLDHLESLGLSLVTLFVQRLQGTFEVTSEHGTRWRIRFSQPS
jgi:two-component sensor histidine kinase